MAVSLDAIEGGRAHAADGVDLPATPPEHPLAMPVQSLREFPRSQRREAGAPAPRAVVRTSLRLRRGACAHRVGHVRDVPGRLGLQRDVSAVGARRALHRQLLVDRAGLHERRRRLRRAAAPSAGGGPASAARDPHGRRHARLQRGDGARLRLAPGDDRGHRANGPPRNVRFLHPVGFHTGRRLDRRGARVLRPPGTPAASPHLLPPPQTQHRAQGGQHRGLRHPLGRRLRPHAGAGRRQPDDRSPASCASRRRWRRIRMPASSSRCPSSSTATRFSPDFSSSRRRSMGR